MSTQYIKTAGGLEQVSEPKMRVYASVDAATADLQNLDEDTFVTSIFADTAGDLQAAVESVANQVSTINSYIPSDTSVNNLLVNQSDLSDLDVGALEDRVDDLEALVPSSASSSNKLATAQDISDLDVDDLETRVDDLEDVVPSTASSSNKLVDTNTLNVLLDTIEPVGTIKLAAVSSGWDSHWHECDGTNGTLDLREAAPVGIGTNSTDTIETHDVYTLGEFKDDQVQEHTHTYIEAVNWVEDVEGGTQGHRYNTGKQTLDTSDPSGRTGTVTRGKRKGVVFIQKISGYSA